MLLWYTKHTREKVLNVKKISLTVFGIFILFVSAAWLINAAKDEQIVKRFYSMFDLSKGSAGGRLEMWRHTIDLIKESPWLGVGAGNWKIVFSKFGVVRSDTMFLAEPLNDYLGIFAETGIMGFMGYTGMLVIALLLLIRAIFSEDKKSSLFRFAVLSSLVIYGVIAFFNFPKDRIEHSVFMIFLLAQSGPVLYSQKPTGKRFMNVVLPVLLFAGLIYSLVCSWYRYSSECYTRQALEAREKQKWNAVIRYINRVESNYYTMDPTTTPVMWYRGIAYYSLGKTDLAFVDFEQAYKANPYHIHVLNNLATCYELKGNHEQAIELYKQAIAIYPFFDDALLNLSAVLYNLKRYEEALESLEHSDAKYNPEILKRRLFLREVIKQNTPDN